MKTKFLGATLGAAMLILAPLALAAQAQPAGETPDPRPRHQAMLERFDADQDGRLDPAEREAARAAMQEERPRLSRRWQAKMEEFDRNQDGALDPEERATFEQAQRKRLEQRPRAMRRFDTDRDGRLSDEEWNQARQAFKQRFGPARSAAPRDEDPPAER